MSKYRADPMPDTRIGYALVGRARAEGAHGDLDGSQRSSEVKWGKLCALATIFGQKKP